MDRRGFLKGLSALGAVPLLGSVVVDRPLMVDAGEQGKLIIAKEMPRNVQGFLLSNGGVKFDFAGPSQLELETLDLAAYPDGFACAVRMDAEGTVKVDEVSEARALIKMMDINKALGVRTRLRAYFSLETV